MTLVVKKLNNAQIRTVAMDGNNTLKEPATLLGTESGIVIFINPLFTSFVYISTDIKAITMPKNRPLAAV